MKKTPLQQLIEEIEKDHGYFLEFGTEDCPVKVLNKRATELLEEEKQVIVEAYCCGDMDCDKVALPETRADEYFKETYQTKEDEKRNKSN